jgi:Flp pilus assembly protein TadG
MPGWEYHKLGWNASRTWLRAWPRSRSGATALEFAMVGPVFVLMLLGIAAYGGYFWLAHSVQQLANDGARSAIAGLSQSERTQLATATVDSEATSYASLNATRLSVSENESSQAVTVSVSYDASSSGFWAFALAPMPATTIARSATVKLGGF